MINYRDLSINIRLNLVIEARDKIRLSAGQYDKTGLQRQTSTKIRET